MSHPAPTSSRLFAWLQLVRLPNLFSVPGDVLAGAFLAAAVGGQGFSPAALAIAAISGVAAYAGGLIDNDRMDLAEDLRERPNRPLPAGRVSVRAATVAGFLLLAVPFLLAAGGSMPAAWICVQILLVATVLAYNRLKARFPRVGFGLMGLCRGLNLLAGAALISDAEGLLGAAVVAACWALYVEALTVFASHETQRAPGSLRYLVILPVLAIGLVGGMPSVNGWTAGALVAASLAGSAGAAEALWLCRPGPDPAAVPRTVGRLVRLLIPMQAALCLAGGPDSIGGSVAGLLLMAAWLVSARLGRWFYAS